MGDAKSAGLRRLKGEKQQMTRGNSPEAWNRLLSDLDEKLQLGLLDRLKRVASYHVEDETLFIEPGSPDDAQYLTKDTVFQQLELLAQETVKVERVKIKLRSE